ncbi:ALDH-like protein, partial [Polyporus arcularius HHB13444]
FASRLAEKVAAFKVGNGLEKDTTHGPLIHDRAIEKVQRHVEDALAQGAQLLLGGKRIEGPGSFFAPTVLSDVPHNALVNQEETFGPLAALTRFETEEEVIRLANDTSVGLAGYFFSRDVGRVWRVAEALEVGMVGTNTGVISQAVIPFGGVKESGLGREGGHGIEEYMNVKFIAFGGFLVQRRRLRARTTATVGAPEDNNSADFLSRTRRQSCRSVDGDLRVFSKDSWDISGRFAFQGYLGDLCFGDIWKRVFRRYRVSPWDRPAAGLGACTPPTLISPPMRLPVVLSADPCLPLQGCFTTIEVVLQQLKR